MCARYTITSTRDKILEVYAAEMEEGWEPNYNVALTQRVPVITADEPGKIQLMHFGLIPWHSVTGKLDYKRDTFNARKENLLTSTLWKPLMERNKTCLIIADGFIEWHKVAGKSYPYHFKLADREIFAFAGLWSQWVSKDKSTVVRSFAIITDEANEQVAKVHDLKKRMPEILPKDLEQSWLAPDLSPHQKIDMLHSYPDELMYNHRLSTAINATVVKGDINNKPELLLPENSE